MREVLKNIINFGTDGLDKRLEKLKLQIFNISCLLGVLVPSISLGVYLWLGKISGIGLSIVSTNIFFFFILLFLNYKKKFYISSVFASIMLLLHPLSLFIISGGLVDYEFLILVLAASPYLCIYKKRWYRIVVFAIFVLCFLVCSMIRHEPFVDLDLTIIEEANRLVYVIIFFAFLYESIAVYYLHEATVKDLEEREQEMSIAKNKAEESDRLKSAFLANISHEIRTPMNSIIGFSEYIIQEEIKEQEKQQYAEIINQSCHQLLNLVNDVLDVSKIETGQVTINKKVASISEILISLYQLFENNAHSKGISFHLNSTISEEQATVLIDEIKVRQILSNFLSNALKYTEKGEIKLGCKMTTNQLHFYVSDTGIGIGEEYQATVFDRFSQVEDSMNVGAGLGLAISRGFAESMGGSVCVNSTLGKGSTFHLSIPYQPILAKQSNLKSAQNASKGIQLDLSDKQILIAEDELFNFKLLEVVFKQLKVKLFWAKNGKEAIEAVNQNPNFDLILMDIKMPIMNGLEATKVIKSEYPSIPIIAQSAFAFTDEREQCLRAGCDDYLSKPIKKQELLELFEFFLVEKVPEESL